MVARAPYLPWFPSPDARACRVCQSLAEEAGEAGKSAAAELALDLIRLHTATGLAEQVIEAARLHLAPFRTALLTPETVSTWRVTVATERAHTRDLLLAAERYPELLAVRRTGVPFVALDVATSPELESELAVLEKVGIRALIACPVFVAPDSAEPAVLRFTWSAPADPARGALALYFAHLLVHRLHDLPPSEVAQQLGMPPATTRSAGPGRLLKLLPLAAVVVDRSGSITSANSRAGRLLVGRDTDLDPTALLAALPGAPWAGVERRWEAEMHTPRGRQRVVGWSGPVGEDLTLVLLDPHPEGEESGRHQAIRAAFAHKVLELEEANRQLAEHAELKVRFVSDAAHELKTPLAILRSYLETLTTDLADGLSEEQRSFLTAATTGAQRLQHLVEGLLDLAAAETGHMPVDLGPTCLATVTAEVADQFAAIAHGAGVHLDRQGLRPVAVRADPERLAQVVRNLVENAVKFSSPGAAVRLTTHLAGDRGVLTVEDSGCGIAPEVLPRIFEPFFRGRGRDGNGTGLGLAIVRRILLAMGGKITVESQVGVGSRFTVELPLWTGGE
ncbi:MAG: HAMP domain-containing histidine kinase [Acidobacteriota bacterium]|jgi:signal transduction histidine kinase